MSDGLFTSSPSKNDGLFDESIGDIGGDYIDDEASNDVAEEQPRTEAPSDNPSSKRSSIIAVSVVGGILVIIMLIGLIATLISTGSVKGINAETDKMYSVATSSSDAMAETARMNGGTQTGTSAAKAHQIITAMQSGAGKVSKTTSADDAARILALPLGLCEEVQNIVNVPNQGTADVINTCRDYNDNMKKYGDRAKIAGSVPGVNAPDIFR